MNMKEDLERILSLPKTKQLNRNKGELSPEEALDFLLDCANTCSRNMWEHSNDELYAQEELDAFDERIENANWILSTIIDNVDS